MRKVWLNDPKVEKERLDTCRICPHVRRPDWVTIQCGKCHCMMTAKVKYAQASCPDGRWGKVS